MTARSGLASRAALQGRTNCRTDRAIACLAGVLQPRCLCTSSNPVLLFLHKPGTNPGKLGGELVLDKRDDALADRAAQIPQAG